MHFGPPKKTIFPTWQIAVCLALLLCLNFSCKQKSDSISLGFEAPDQGQNVNVGAEIKIKLAVPKETKIDSVNYFIDGKLISKKNNADSMVWSTKGMPLGYRIIRAIVYRDSQQDTLITNIVLKSDQKPAQLGYKIVNTFPHDTSAYTEGLSFVDGKLLESTGEKGASTLKWVDLKSGKTLQQAKLPAQYFGEGSVKIGNKIIMLTWQENIGLIFDAKTLKELGTFPYQNSPEGWGLTFDGKNILRTDGSNRIWQMNASTFKEENYIEVYDEKEAVHSLNELEYIDGKIYANVYLSNKIVIINPTSGKVEAEIDLSAIVPKNYFKSTSEAQNNVLNGIAWDAKGKRLFVGGKKWPKLYEISLTPAPAK